MVNYLDSRRIMGTTAERSSIPTPATQGGWVELGRTTLGSAGDTITVSGLADKRYLMILTDYFNSGGTNVYDQLRFNGDTGTNYAYRSNLDGGSDSTATSQTVISTSQAYCSSQTLNIAYVANYATKEKLVINHEVEGEATGATNAPRRGEQVGKWANTSNAISSVTKVNLGTNDFASGSECVVLGWDPSDTHTTNFWEELADVTLSSASTTLSSGTISAKKYLWVQVYVQHSIGNTKYLRFNSDTGTNYSNRRSENGGADSTRTSESGIRDNINTTTTPVFVNYFIINNQSNEKLVMWHTNSQDTAGAGTAPSRIEGVGKWTNTSNQITQIDITSDSSNDFSSGSFIKVWGSD